MDLADTLEATIRDQSLQQTAVSLGEIGLDSLLDDGTLRDIPIIGTLLGIAKSAVNIRDRLFIAKLQKLLNELRDVPPAKRDEMIQRINDSPEFEIRVGEKILYITERCSDHVDAAIIGRLFRSYLEERITYSEFLRLSRCVDKVMPDDLNDFISSEWERESAANATHLLQTGLVYLENPEIRVEDQWDHKMSNKYIVDGNEMTVYVTELGEKMRSILRSQPSTIGG